MKSKNLLGAGVALLSLTSSITTGSASTLLYGNLGSVNASTTSNTAGYLSNAQSNQFNAQGFTLGADYDYDLTSLEFGLGSTGSPAPSVQIFSNNAGAPGSALATFLLSPAGSVASKSIYTFTGSFAAQKNTSYWVVLSNANSAQQESFEWYSNDAFTSPTGLNDSGIAYLGTKDSNGGVSWNDTLPSLAIQVTGTAITAVPEPGSALGTVGLVAGGLFLRRRKKPLHMA